MAITMEINNRVTNMPKTIKIYNEDCMVGMKRIPDGSVDLIITDHHIF